MYINIYYILIFLIKSLIIIKTFNYLIIPLILLNKIMRIYGKIQKKLNGLSPKLSFTEENFISLLNNMRF